jgi:hypothetical protein
MDDLKGGFLIDPNEATSGDDGMGIADGTNNWCDG